MAKAIVTAESVAEAAAALAAAGVEPSIIAVQERIGGGSYTTVKRYLEAWRQERANQPAIELPAEIAARGTTMLQALWQAAVEIAEQQTAQARAEAERQVVEARAALTAAEQTIARLEAERDAQDQQVAEQAETIEHLRELAATSQTAAQVAEARASGLNEQVNRLRSELAAVRQAALDQARLEGELAAVRRQVEDQAAVIQRLTAAGHGGIQ